MPRARKPTARRRPAAPATDAALATMPPPEHWTGALLEVARLLAETMDLDRVLARVIEAAAELLQAPTAAVALTEPAAFLPGFTIVPKEAMTGELVLVVRRGMAEGTSTNG